MMKRIYYLLMVLVLLGTNSCQKFLDTKPKDFLSQEYYYNNETQINTALTGVYGIMSDSRNSEPFYAQSYICAMGTEGDDGYFRLTPTRNVVGQFLYNASTPPIVNLWQLLYKGINLANALLENLDRADMAPEKKEIVRGEALFLRSYYYFILVSNWGDVPLKLESTNSETEVTIPRTPSREVYQQIVKDMEKAYTLVSTATEVGFGGRVNKSAVAGILARVNLYWAGFPLNETSRYQQAADWARKVIESGEHRLNPSYEQVFKNYAADQYDIGESIWEVEFWGNRIERPRQAGLVGNYIGIRSDNADEIGISNGYIRASARLYRLYGTGDLRRDRNISPFSYSPLSSTNEVYYSASSIWHRYAGKYRRKEEVFRPKAKNYTPINYPILRYSDVLLMFAEAENKALGAPSAEAVKYLNQVRRRAYGKDVNVPNVAIDMPSGYDNIAFDNFIRDERSRELCFESLRKNDLIRWGIYVNSMKALATDYETGSGVPVDTRDVVANLKYIGQKHLLWPIPTYELSLNSKLTQNPGW